jgi:hypothetical protein
MEREPVRVYISGVDAPELSQPWGPEAKAFLERLVANKTVTVRIRAALERLAQVEIDGSPISVSVIRSGMGWHCPRFAHENELAAAEAEARQGRRGLWAESQPTRPWIHRGAGACWQRGKSAGAKSPRGADFSGVWVAISPSGHAGQTLTIVQDERTLTLRQDSAESFAYKLEGMTSRAFTTEFGPADTVAKSRWNDNVWTVEERHWIVRGQEPRSVRQRFWLDSAGFLNVERSTPQPIGEYDSTIVRYRLADR